MKAFLLSTIGIALMELLLSAYAGSDSMKSAIHLLCGTAMAVLVLSRVVGFDYSSYAASIARTNPSAHWSTETAAESGRQLNRQLIEDRCRAYILDKADEMDVKLSDASVILTWSTEGYWYPTASMLTLSAGQERSEALARVLESDFGIPPNRVEWREAESNSK